MMTAAEIERFLEEHFPQALEPGFCIDELGEGRISLRLPFDAANLRPGGTLSGPTLMMLADTAMFFMVLAALGPVAGAVTSSLHIDFLRRPKAGDAIADGELLKLGKRLAVGRILLRAEGSDEPVAHATVTYSLPG